MKHSILSFSIPAIVFLIILSSCSSTQPISDGQDRIDDIPEWIINPPADTNEFLYGTGEAQSSRLNIARNRADIAAKTELASKMGEKIEALQKLFEEEVDSDSISMYSGAFTNATQIIVSQELRGVSTTERKFSARDGNGYISYVLMQMPVGTAREQLENALSRDEEMYIRFKESKAFEELQNNLERLGLD